MPPCKKIIAPMCLSYSIKQQNFKKILTADSDTLRRKTMGQNRGKNVSIESKVNFSRN